MTSSGHRPLIQFEDVGFRHRRSRVPALQRFNLSISDGELFVLLGPSGCGKTTALNLLAGFERPSEGRVIVKGREIRGPGVDRTVIFQGDDSLFPWLTALDNISFGLRVAGASRKSRREVAERYLRLTHLEGQGHKFPSQLSGGMKQRVQLARALACSTTILLMDEPFAAVDAQTRAVLQDELVSIWQSTRLTILFITHDIIEAILLADRVGVMTPGPGGSIQEIMSLDRERPRAREDPWVGAMYARIHAGLAAPTAAEALRGA